MNEKQLWRRYISKKEKQFTAWRRKYNQSSPCEQRLLLELESVPTSLNAIRCGARTRRGSPCKQRAVFSNGRCKWHGGLSTGPKTERGKVQALRNLERAKAKKMQLRNSSKVIEG